MKKIRSTLITIFTLILFTSTAFAESAQLTAYNQNKDALIEHLTVIDKYQNGILLLSKNVFNDSCNNKDNLDVYLKEINYFIQQISSRSKALTSQCKVYTIEDSLLCDLLTIDIILYEYRLSLVHLYQYLTVDNLELQYKNKQLFFSFFTDANKKLLLLKETIR